MIAKNYIVNGVKKSVPLCSSCLRVMNLSLVSHKGTKDTKKTNQKNLSVVLLTGRCALSSTNLPFFVAPLYPYPLFNKGIRACCWGNLMATKGADYSKSYPCLPTPQKSLFLSAYTVTLFIIFSLFILPGCKEPKVKGLVSVRGTVTYNEAPLEGAAVCFTPKEFKTGDRLGTGKTDAQGKFELRTIGEPGVLPGEYIVVIVKNEMSPGKESAQRPKVDPKTGKEIPARPSPPTVKPLLPKRYGDPKTSDVNVTVGKDGLQDWRLELVD